jgi:hypothetical protein
VAAAAVSVGRSDTTRHHMTPAGQRDSLRRPAREAQLTHPFGRPHLHDRAQCPSVKSRTGKRNRGMRRHSLGSSTLNPKP